jgi:hypothetical protein
MKKDDMKKCAECHEKLAEAHAAAQSAHQGISECTKAEAAGDVEKAKKHDYHEDLADAHGAMASEHNAMAKVFHAACGKADESGDLEKITPVEKALLAKLAKSVIPDHIHATGTRENPNRLIGRAGDPAPDTQDSEIPQEFVDVFAV